ncbi:MAG: hypothetical protein FWC41_07935 [Firmicutes bacterium]|nr:hypothetical protein [Bacillota bacterium]
MNSFFKKTRIKSDQLLNDAYVFVRNVYNNTSNVFTASSPFGQILTALANFVGLNLYYTEDSITELNINTASRPQNIDGLAQLAGHTATLAQAPTGLLSLTRNSNIDPLIATIRIPNYAKIRMIENNLDYLMINTTDYLNVTFNNSVFKPINFRVHQGTLQNQQFTGTSEQLQTYELNLKEGEWVAEGHIFVHVNGEKITTKDSTYDMSYNELACVVKRGINSGIAIRFGTGTMGFVPQLGSEIFVEYLITNGDLGNVPRNPNYSFIFDDYGFDQNGNEVDLNHFFDINMVTGILNGAEPEPIELTRMLAPATSRAMVLAQTTNYESLFLRTQQFSLIKVWTEYNHFNPYVDNIVHILLVPNLHKRLLNNFDYFNLPLERFLLTSYEKYEITNKIEISGAKVFGTWLSFVDPQFEKYAINVYIKAFRGSNVASIKGDITNAISNYLLHFNRYDYMPKSDLIALIEDIKQVDAVNIEFINEDVEWLFGRLFAGLNGLMDLLKVNDQKSNRRILNIDEYNELYNYFINNVNSQGIFIQTKQEVYNKFITIPSIRRFVNSHFDEQGNILFEREVYPIFKGGFTDRYGNYYNENIIDNKLSPLNIYVDLIDALQKDTRPNMISDLRI